MSDAIEASANRGKSDKADEQSLSCEDRNLETSLVEMLDGVIMLYHIAVHKQLSKVRSWVRVLNLMKLGARSRVETTEKLFRPFNLVWQTIFRMLYALYCLKQ